MRKLNRLQSLLILGAALFLTACSNGGNLSLEPGAKKVTSKGSPFVTVNQGGKALLIGGSGASEVRGYVTVQAVTAGTLSGGSGQPQVIMNKAQAQANH